MTISEAIYIVNKMARVLSDSALILDRMGAHAGEPDDYRLTARHRRKEAEALQMVITAATGFGVHAVQCPQCQAVALGALRDCRCVDPENCIEPVPGRKCRRA